jgi:hypothetical protein
MSTLLYQIPCRQVEGQPNRPRHLRENVERESQCELSARVLTPLLSSSCISFLVRRIRCRLHTARITSSCCICRFHQSRIRLELTIGSDAQCESSVGHSPL